LLFVSLSILFVLAFRKIHRHFLAIVKYEEAFAASPSLVSRETPYWERVWIEWNVSFGLFLVAVLVGFGTLTFRQLLYYSPVGTFVSLVMIFTGSFLVAMISARFPFLRWLINMIGASLIAFFAIGLFHQLNPLGMRFHLATVESWPVVYSFMILSVFLMFSMFMLLLYGGLSLKRKWCGGNFTLRREDGKDRKVGGKITVAYCVGVMLILVGAWFYQTKTKITWCYISGIITQNRLENLSEADIRRSMDFYCEALRLAPELSIDRAVTVNLMSQTLFSSYKYKPEVVLAGYDRAIALLVERDEVEFRHNYAVRKLIGERGIVQFLYGDYRAAIEDFTRVIDVIPWSEFLYQRGFAYEKLGDIDAAIADYSAALDTMEKHDNPVIVTSLTHQVPEEDLRNHPSLTWYNLTPSELKAIINRLKSEPHAQ